MTSGNDVELFVETRGSGFDVVLLHGWGLHSGIWEDTVQALAAEFRVTCVDLPGHGRSPWPSGGIDLAALARRLTNVVPAPAAWVGWSLGGMIALRLAADFPQQVGRLALIGALPRFVHAPDWPHAMAPQILAQFARELEQDYDGTLSRFLALQTRGSERGHETVRRLRHRLRERAAPDPRALAAGLAWLRDIDLRSRLADVRCPCLLIMGERDLLAPHAAGRDTAQAMARARLHLIAGAGHAPFLSHAGEFLSVLRAFLWE
ncbi:MAG: pimeloyl-ACP methyl ester esterase BioH [Gammaproteobacteria bacterium]|nr:pimeloyl-ACP methyl ester esterase BioH [Gammaproteobacteria bacterium]